MNKRIDSICSSYDVNTFTHN